YRLEQQFVIERGDDPPYSLIDPDPLSIPPCLMGVQLDAENSIYLCDNITDKLIKIGPDGREQFAVGSRGEGPEDHADAGEPLFWPGSGIARSDCSAAPKVILYDEAGGFLRSIKFGGYDQVNRVWVAGDQVVAVAADMDGTPISGVKVQSYLLTLQSDGTVMQSIPVRQAEIPPMGLEQVPHETDFEIIPRVAVDSGGNIYLQRDLYRYAVECYDADLTLRWTCERDVPTPKWSDEEFAQRRAEREPYVEAHEYRHVIRRIVPGADGTVWVERTEQEAAPGSVLLDRIGADGEYRGQAEVTGLPKVAGEYLIFGDRLLWKVDDDAEVGEADIPYLVVYRLVRV
ncbi:MAG: hypothetical protein ABIF77_08290, partial [bacterium]